MNLTPSEQLIVIMKFDSYIKKCCRNELRNLERSSNRIQRREISISDFTIIKIEVSRNGLATPDFIVKGHEITVDNSRLLKALEMLDSRERELILLIFFMGFRPEDISKELNVGERTVYNRQKRILKKLKKLMEENA